MRWTQTRSLVPGPTKWTARCRTLGCTGVLWLGFVACTGGGPQQGFGVSDPGGGDGGGSTDSHTETGDNQELEGLALGSPIDCPNPKSEVAYEEVGEALGLSGDTNPDRARVEGGSASWSAIHASQYAYTELDRRGSRKPQLPIPMSTSC